MIEFRITITADKADNLSDQLFLLGANAVSLEEMPDQASSECELIALFEDAALANDIHHYLQAQQSQRLIKAFRMLTIEDREWVRACLDQLKPERFGKKLWICPNWCKPPAPDTINVMLDPGLAFGTGTHPTTKLCLEWLEQHINGNEHIIDYGCGSGILAVAALKLGAAHAIAVDNDQNALDACSANLKQNNIAGDKCLIVLPTHSITEQADILIANILLQPLIDLCSHFTSLVKPGGKIILSGILSTQVPDVIQAYQQAFAMAHPVLYEGWACIEGEKKMS